MESPYFRKLGKKIQEEGLVLATGNKHKLYELTEILTSYSVKVENILDILNKPENLIQDQEKISFHVQETGQTFQENASLKAKACFEKTKRISLADDSGLVVDALDGRPGIYSARYGGKGLSDQERCLRLLEELKTVPKEKRTARFICVLALCMKENADESSIQFFEGQMEGEILFDLVGENGFGYDPIFFVPEYNISFAGMKASEKNRLSHRAKAMEKFLQIF